MGTYFSKEKLDLLKAQFDTAEYDAEQAEPAIYIGKEQLLDLMKVLRETPTYAFDRMSCLTAVDYKEYYEMVYCLYSRRYDLWVTVKVKLDHDNPEVESMTQIWEGTNFEERETYDLMGIKFLNHPDLHRILLPDNYEAHPLQKDFVPLEPRVEGGVLTWHKPKNLS